MSNGALSWPKKLSLLSAAGLFVSAGTLHLLRPAPFVKIVPPALPRPDLLVFVSGVAEIAGGAGLLVPAVRRLSGWGLVALLIAVFPANVYMATNNVQVTAKPLPPAALWGRLPLQAILIWWILWATKQNSSGPDLQRA